MNDNIVVRSSPVGGVLVLFYDDGLKKWVITINNDINFMQFNTKCDAMRAFDILRYRHV